MFKQALTAIKTAQVAYLAIPVRVTKDSPLGKRHGNALFAVSRVLVADLMYAGMEEWDAWQVAHKMTTKFKQVNKYDSSSMQS